MIWPREAPRRQSKFEGKIKSTGEYVHKTARADEAVEVVALAASAAKKRRRTAQSVRSLVAAERQRRAAQIGWVEKDEEGRLAEVGGGWRRARAWTRRVLEDGGCEHTGDREVAPERSDYIYIR